MFSGAELQNARFENPGHPYPELICARLKDLWKGPRRTDFDPRLMAAVGRHLGKHNLPREKGDQVRWINNRIKEGDWTALEIAWDEGLAAAEAAKAGNKERETLTPNPSPDGRGGPEWSEEEREASKAALEKAKAKFKLGNRRSRDV